MLKYNKNQKIYVVCPAYGKTGGLELLHQLVYELNSIGLNAKITYINVTNENPINPAFEKYVKDYVNFYEMEDSSENLVIFPEILIEFFDKVKECKRIVWWLSVDNYEKMYSPKKAFELLGIIGVLYYIKHKRWRYRVSKVKDKIELNLAQSYYAIDYLNKKNFKNIYYLSDYINEEYLLNPQLDMKRNNVVLYNPKKGKEFTKFLMSLDKNIEWIPLINLSNKQVKELLETSKIYIDFGNHPGKDRFPREAASCGCCIITGKDGSANFYNDIPIPDKYKFKRDKKNGEFIINQIKDCLINYDENYKEFNTYRTFINSEPEIFSKDTWKIFKE